VRLNATFVPLSRLTIKQHWEAHGSTLCLLSALVGLHSSPPRYSLLLGSPLCCLARCNSSRAACSHSHGWAGAAWPIRQRGRRPRVHTWWRQEGTRAAGCRWCNAWQLVCLHACASPPPQQHSACQQQTMLLTLSRSPTSTLTSCHLLSATAAQVCAHSASPAQEGRACSPWCRPGTCSRAGSLCRPASRSRQAEPARWSRQGQGPRGAPCGAGGWRAWLQCSRQQQGRRPCTPRFSGRDTRQTWCQCQGCSQGQVSSCRVKAGRVACSYLVPKMADVYQASPRCMRPTLFMLPPQPSGGQC
jgi:hypothetical protein